ncbi:hypothetical protein BLOT_008852 [Blomia tropicalis]|nr:hypothetical protein BLOT_008852 [Blomia tropicalis]
MADLVHSTTTTKASTGSIISLAVPNTSYDSAIDSLPDEYGLIDFHRSSPTIIDNSNCIRHVGLTSPSSPLTTNNITSSSNRPHQLHRPLLRSIASSTKCANHNHHHHQQLKQRQTYRSISEHQCQHDTIEQPHVQSPLLVNKVNQTINRTSMAMFLDQIDASSTLLGNGKSQTSSSSSSSSSANQKQLVVIGQHSHSAQQQRGETNSQTISEIINCAQDPKWPHC